MYSCFELAFVLIFAVVILVYIFSNFVVCFRYFYQFEFLIFFYI